MTPLIRRVVSEKRIVIIPLVVAMVVNVVAYVFVVYPRGVKAAGAADRAKAATADLGAAERENAVARGLVTGKARADEALNAFYGKVLPANLDAARRLTYGLHPLAQKTGVRLQSTRSEVDENTRKDDSLGHFTISMVLTGEYPNFRAFMYALEQAPNFLIIDDVQLTEGNPNEPLTLVLRMSTYFRLNDHGA